MSNHSIWEYYNKQCSEKLYHSLIQDFPLIIHDITSNKVMVETYLHTLQTMKHITMEILELIQKNASDRELRDFMKIFQLPLGLRNKLVVFITQLVIGYDGGQLLLDSIYIVENISSTQMKVIHPNWGCFLVAEASPRRLSEETLQYYRMRCNQWSSIGHHRNLLPGYFCRLNSKHQQLLFFYEMPQTCISLSTFFRSINKSSMSDLYNVRTVLQIMITLCYAIELCHNKGLPHLNISPDSILLVQDRQASDTEYSVLLSSLFIGSGKGKIYYSLLYSFFRRQPTGDIHSHIPVASNRYIFSWDHIFRAYSRRPFL